MKPRALLIFGVLVGAVVSEGARAASPVDVEVAGKAGVLTNPLPTNSLYALGFGLGARAGVSFHGWYGGVTLGAYSFDAQSGPQGPFYETVVQYGIEAGYSIVLGRLTLRPELGFGDLTISTASSTSSLFLQPGVLALVSFGQLYLGGDAGLFFIPAGGANAALALNAHVGLKF